MKPKASILSLISIFDKKLLALSSGLSRLLKISKMLDPQELYLSSTVVKKIFFYKLEKGIRISNEQRPEQALILILSPHHLTDKPKK